MDDIHMPTVPSGQMTNGINGTEAKSLSELTVEKDRIESELSALSAVLDSHNVNMNTSLTTLDGFPRADIDVAQIRTTRARIIHLRNDYKAVMTKLDKAVQEQFERLAQTSTLPSREGVSSRNNTSTERDNSGPAAARETTPFANVDEVTPSSPASVAGLQVGDKVTQFGIANWTNHDGLRKVAEFVSQNEGRPIPVTVIRDTAVTRLVLTPRRNWGGRGLLGCHLVPI